MELKSQKRRVLCFGRDPFLLQTRWMVLEQRYDASAVHSVDELLQLASNPQFEVVLLCHTLSAAECRLATQICRDHWPQAKLVALVLNHLACSDHADEVVRGIDGPAVMLQAIDRLLPATAG